MAVLLSPVGGVAAQFFDNDGNVLSGGKIYTYAAGTTTPQTTYTTSLGNIAHANPIILDSAGRVPTGEIWLTDGSIYKFVLKDANDTLIATYDNIVGINSNFVNYTAQQEIQTATAGQTVFTLTTMSYQTGTNSLTVYVDGVNQYGPGAQYAYTETSSTSVTFNSGLHVGAEVKFTTTTQTTGNATTAAVVAYDPPFTGSVPTNVEAKLAQTVSVMDFGAVGDGATDDTLSVHAALDYAKNNGCSVFFPAGKYRVTSGYTNSTLRGDVSIFGEGLDYAASNVGQINTSCILLDSVDSASFFYQQTADNQLSVNNMVFACNQYVVDRKFFVTSSGSRHHFDNVNFVAVEQPFVYLAGTYFQMNVYRNIRFTNSGSFHSKTTNLIGTFMLIENCDVEGTIPANTEKIICKLTGIRQLQATNFLIEPAVPSTGWIALFLENDYDPTWIRGITATFRGFWMEVTTNPLLYSLYQVSGRTKFISPQFNNGAAAPIRLDNLAAIEFDTATFSGTGDPLQNYFLLQDGCQVKLSNCNYRNEGTAIVDPRFTLENCSLIPNGAVGAAFDAISHSNLQPELLWKFDGGYPDPGNVLVTLSGGTTIAPTTNISFGRALNVYPNANTINCVIQGYTRGDFPKGGQFFLVLRATMPTLSSGTIAVNMTVDGATIANPANYTSGQDIRLVYPLTSPSLNPTNVGVGFSASTATSELVIYQLELWIGKSLPNVTMPSFPQNVQTYAAAAPLTGSWARGDIVWNNTPAIGQPKGWVCTAAGAPGTWVSMGNL